MMQSFTSSDGLVLKYFDSGIVSGDEAQGVSGQVKGDEKPWLIFIHGFTGTHRVWSRNVPALAQHYRIIAPDLRGHGESQTPSQPFTLDKVGVERLARDLRELIESLSGDGNAESFRCRAIGGSLGCAVIWSYAHLFSASTFTHAIFIDQSPLQNSSPDWQPPYCHKGLRSAHDFAAFENLITTDPTKAHLGTIHSCLGYLSHPIPSYDPLTDPKYQLDKEFFLGEALRGDSNFYAALMKDHTALDHRNNIVKAFGPGSQSKTKVLVLTSSKSGCFDSEGPLSVVGFVNGNSNDGRLAEGEVADWGGHWCYWEDPSKFNELAFRFLQE